MKDALPSLPPLTGAAANNADVRATALFTHACVRRCSARFPKLRRGLPATSAGSAGTLGFP
eukprot:5582419-Prymnesium_polylepis.1